MKNMNEASQDANIARLKANLSLLSGSDLDAARKIDAVDFSNLICQKSFNWNMPRESWWLNVNDKVRLQNIAAIYSAPFAAIFVHSTNDVDKKFEMLKIFSDLIGLESTTNKYFIYQEAIKYLDSVMDIKGAPKDDCVKLKKKLEDASKEIIDTELNVLCEAAAGALGGNSQPEFVRCLFNLYPVEYFIPMHQVSRGNGATPPAIVAPTRYRHGGFKIFFNWITSNNVNVPEKIFGDGTRDLESYVEMLNSYSHQMALVPPDDSKFERDAFAYVCNTPHLRKFAVPFFSKRGGNLPDTLTKLYRLTELIEWLCIHGAIRIKGYEVNGLELKPSATIPTDGHGRIELMGTRLSHNALNDLAGLVVGLNYGDMLNIKSKVGSSINDDTLVKQLDYNEWSKMISLSRQMDAVSAQLSGKFDNPTDNTERGRSNKELFYKYLGTRVGPRTTELQDKWKELRWAEYPLYADVHKKIEETSPSSEQQYQKLCRLVDWIDWLKDQGAVTIAEVNNNNQPTALNQGDRLVDCEAKLECQIVLSKELKELLNGLNYQEMSDLKDNYADLDAHSDTLGKIDKITQQLDHLSRQVSQFGQGVSNSSPAHKWEEIRRSQDYPTSPSASSTQRSALSGKDLG